MEKVTPFLYKYIYLFDEQVVYRLSLKAPPVKVEEGITEALKDEKIESWMHGVVMKGNNAIDFFKKRWPDSERSDWFFIKDRPFIPREMVKKVLVAKRLPKS